MNNREEAARFLETYGVDSEMSHDLVREIISKHSQFTEVIPMAKKSLFAELIDNIKKSMGGGKAGGADDEDIEAQKPNSGGGDGDDDEDDEEFVDAEEVIKALADEVEQLKVGQEKIIAALAQSEKFQKSMGEGMIGLMEAYGEIAKTPLPRKGTSGDPGMNKGGFTGAAHQHRQFKRGDFDTLRPIMTKAVTDGELSLQDCGKLETQINKSIMNPEFQIDPKFAAFLEKKLAN